MNNRKEITGEGEVSFSEIVLIFIKRKWWFIGTFLIILVIGLIYVFIQPVNHILTYQIEMKEKYTNQNLNKYYPNYENDLNYLSIQNIPVIFKSEKVFRSINNIEGIDYQKLRESDSVKIILNEETSIFNIIVSRDDYKVADNIAKNLIESFEGVVVEKETMIMNTVIDNIKTDIDDFEGENTILLDTKIAGLEDRIDELYSGLDRYILDYNIELSDKLEENKNSENVSFYNVIIPPNDISDEIDTLQKEILIYETKVLENKNIIIDLNNLTQKLQKDEDIIKGRIRLLSDSPLHRTESSRSRNSVIVIGMSILLGVIATFIINFFYEVRIKERSKRDKNLKQ